MKNIIEQSRHVLDRRLEKISGPDALREIFKVGSSAGGAQAKAVVGWNSETDKFCVPSDEMPDGFEHWIIKITPDERPYLGIAEYRTYELAKMCGVEGIKCTMKVDDKGLGGS
jgi:serine/threonine-protein kinase HipA